MFPTGDLGADECPNDGLTRNVPRWPASSQYGIAVAGTTLLADETTDTWSSETAWAKTGGSLSTFEPKPVWQQNFSETVGATTHLVPGTTRAAADVAFDADPKSGVLYFAGPGLVTGGGTGLAGPIFAGVWARVLQAHPGIGFAGPVIYALPRADFHDVTSGNNGVAAHTSYDVVSGRGSMIIDSVVADSLTLGNTKPVANWSDVATSLSVQFTDTSTDSDGSIVFHSWTFGDGAVSNAANPTHAYATAGTYSVTEIVKDNDGAQASKKRSIAIGP